MNRLLRRAAKVALAPALVLSLPVLAVGLAAGLLPWWVYDRASRRIEGF